MRQYPIAGDRLTDHRRYLPEADEGGIWRSLTTSLQSIRESPAGNHLPGSFLDIC